MHKNADTIATLANTQKLPFRSRHSPLGSDGSHSVDTGWVCEHKRSRSYTKRRGRTRVLVVHAHVDRFFRTDSWQ